MAKITFTKLNLSKEIPESKVTINDNEVVVKNFLSAKEQEQFVHQVVNSVIKDEENNFYNPLKFEIYFKVAVVEFYTNISFSDKQKGENIFSTYDALTNSEAYAKITEKCSSIFSLRDLCLDTLDNYYKHRNSLLGIMESIGANYDNTKFDITNLIGDLRNTENFELLREIAPLIGPNNTNQ